MRTMKSDLVEELRDYYEQLENIKEDALELTAPLQDTQFNWRPSPKGWSISECLCHLNLANGLDVPMLTEEIERGRAAGLTAKGQLQDSRRTMSSRNSSQFTTGCWT